MSLQGNNDRCLWKKYKIIGGYPQEPVLKWGKLMGLEGYMEHCKWGNIK